jgi:hypothetical protein
LYTLPGHRLKSDPRTPLCCVPPDADPSFPLGDIPALPGPGMKLEGGVIFFDIFSIF